MPSVRDEELKKVIANFLEMGYVDNIISMFRKEPHYFEWTGELLEDERFAVRLGLTVLFEEMCSSGPGETVRAIPSLAGMLSNESPLLRGEAIGILGLIGTDEAFDLIRSMTDDSSPQVQEMAAVALAVTEHLKQG